MPSLFSRVTKTTVLMMPALSICKYEMTDPDPNKDIIAVAIKSKYDGEDARDENVNML